MKKCEVQGCNLEAIPKERFCRNCKKDKLNELNDAGYFTKTYGLYGRARSNDQKENIRETKYGKDR